MPGAGEEDVRRRHALACFAQQKACRRQRTGERDCPAGAPHIAAGLLCPATDTLAPAALFLSARAARMAAEPRPGARTLTAELPRSAKVPRTPAAPSCLAMRFVSCTCRRGPQKKCACFNQNNFN
eukprot:352599-Chlamydomonas_euryale.AAC.1